MKKTLILTVFLTIFAFSYAFSVTLVDVPSGHWAEDAVQKLVDSGLLEGYPDGTYKGDRPLTRYEYAMVVARMMDKMDAELCAKDDPDCAGKDYSGDIEELKGIIEKLAAEFEDELAALKVKVDQIETKVAGIEDKLESTFFNIDISGNIRQRIDVPNSDLTALGLAQNFLGPMYDPGLTTVTAGTTYNVAAGYEMVPYLELNGGAGEKVNFSIGLEQYFRNDGAVGPLDLDANVGNDDLEVEHAYVDLDFSEDVRELDLLTIRSGYQFTNYGPYGLLVDTWGNDAMPGVSFAVGKDRVKLSGGGMLYSANTQLANVNLGGGMGSASKDPYITTRLDVDLDEVRLGVNFLANGVLQEQGWGVDVDADILTHSDFITGIRGEYMTITDNWAGIAPAANADDYSFIIGVDAYETKRTLVTVSYADMPAASVMTGMDANPFTEYDMLCPMGLDVGGVGATCYTYESGRVLFPMGFKGIGLEASHIVLGDVKIAAKGIYGDFAGGSFTGYGRTIADLEGMDYPAYGALSVTKPINDQSTFRVEYQRQGGDDLLFDRIRSELLINF